MQTELLTKRCISKVGEEIPHELGAKMVLNYQKANPSDAHFYIIGKEVINKILAQPGCAGLKLYNAYNETGEKTLVYVGITEEGKAILQYSTVNTEGILSTEKGIVADRIPMGKGSDGVDDWGWNVD